MLQAAAAAANGVKHSAAADAAALHRSIETELRQQQAAELLGLEAQLESSKAAAMKEMGDEFCDTARRAARELAVRERCRILIDQQIGI